MDAIKQQVAELRTVWAEAYAAMRANPSSWQPLLPGVFVEQIDEGISTIAKWIEEISAPDGYKPSFHLAKSVIATALPQLLVTAKALQKGEYNYAPSFVAGLNQILSALHTMVVFSSKSEGKQLAADLTAQLAEAISLVGTAQRELRDKAEVISKTLELVEDTKARSASVGDLQSKIEVLAETSAKTFDKLAADTQNQSTKTLADLQANITKSVADIEAEQKRLNATTETEAKAVVASLKEQTSKTVESIQTLHEEAVEKEKSISADAAKCEDLRKQSEALLRANAEFSEKLAAQSKELSALQETSRAQQLLISELLPDAASAGLAAGFEARARELNPTKYLWATTFILSIIGLICMTLYFTNQAGDKKDVEMLIALLQRLPYVAPFIWLGWFSAIQYGNTIRVQEDYAFKGATAKAFAGFKDHMDHLASVDLSEGNNAMKLLAAATISTLAHEPLRIFQKTDKDASPTGQFMSMFDRGEAAKK